MTEPPREDVMLDYARRVGLRGAGGTRCRVAGAPPPPPAPVYTFGAAAMWVQARGHPQDVATVSPPPQGPLLSSGPA